MQRGFIKHQLPLLCAAILLFSAVSARPVDQSSEFYVVRAQDTLWDLAEKFFSDPEAWVKIWNANRQISDPNWIYPGDQLLIVLDSPKVSLEPLPIQPAVQQAQRLGLVPTQEPEKAAYIDNLIDPSVPADSYLDALSTRKNHNNLWGKLDQSIELHSQYRKTTQLNTEIDDQAASGSIDLGLHYIARKSTRNWGNFRLNLIALQEENRNSFLANTNNQSGLARFSLEQYNLPINDRLSLNNILGTHRQARYNPFRDRPNLINYRFGAAEPDILGFSSQLLAGHTGLAVSAGRLGQSQGSLLPGFVRTSGNVKRIQATHVSKNNAITADVWRTSDQESIDNRTGFRLGYDRLFSDKTVLSLNAVRSGTNSAFLIGGSTISNAAQHDFGAYYFQPDIIWLDQRIGDDNVGGFYRFQTRTSVRNWGGSIELRKDGLQNPNGQKTTSGFLSLNMAHRLSRQSSLNHVYNYRAVRSNRVNNAQFNGTDTNNSDEHSIRSFYSTTHRSGSRNNINALLRLGSNSEEWSLGYGYSKELAQDATLELTSTYRSQFGSNARSKDWLINTSLSKQFAHGTYLSAGGGYNFGRSLLDDNEGLTSYLNLEQNFGANFSLSMQLDYSRESTRFSTENDFEDTFFTNNEFFDENEFGSRQFFALLSLRYQRGGNSTPEVLHRRGRGNGSGAVRGFVFVDNNNDGIRQASEPGVPGVTVFLNSVYPVVTDSRGEYSFPSVGLGSHFLFIDESALPLPWTLTDGEYTPLTVELRRSVQLNIAVSPITLAEAD